MASSTAQPLSVFKSGGLFQLGLKVTYDSDYKEGARLLAQCGDGTVDTLQGEVMARLREAQVIRDLHDKQEQGLSAFRSTFLSELESLEKKVREETEEKNFEGLLGEIITEIVVENCLSVEILDINWRNTGRANRGGMDIAGVWNRTDSEYLVLIDSKYCGTSLLTPEAYARRRIVEAVDDIEDYQNNELKMARSFVSIASRKLKTPGTLNYAVWLFNLFDIKPRLLAPTVIVPVKADLDSIVQDPPKPVRTTQFHLALSLIDVKDCPFISELGKGAVVP